MSDSSQGPIEIPPWDDGPLQFLGSGSSAQDARIATGQGNRRTHTSSAIPWHPDTTQLVPRIVRRVVNGLDSLRFGQFDLWSEPILVAVQRPGRTVVYDVCDATGRPLAESRPKRSRRGQGVDMGAKSVKVIPNGRSPLSLRVDRAGNWTLKGGSGERRYSYHYMPEDMRGLALMAVGYCIEDREVARRVTLPDDLGVPSRRFVAPVTDSIERRGTTTAVVQSGYTAPVRAHDYPGLQNGAAWTVLCRLRRMDRPLDELIVCDWLSPAHAL